MSEEVTVCELSKEKKEISLGEKTFYNKLLEKKLKTVYITRSKNFLLTIACARDGAQRHMCTERKKQGGGGGGEGEECKSKRGKMRSANHTHSHIHSRAHAGTLTMLEIKC